MPISSRTAASVALVLALGLGLGACNTAGHPTNHSLYSVKQPVVERQNFTLDVAAGQGGLSIPEQQRLAGWFETLNLRYGDRVALDASVADQGVTDDIAGLVARHGLLLSDAAPITEGVVAPGTARVVVTRSRAHVPDCPDWSNNYGSNLANRTSENFGCAVNSNLAAMVADPEHLLQGARGSGETVVMSSTKAINTYRSQQPTGAEGLADVSSQGN